MFSNFRFFIWPMIALLIAACGEDKGGTTEKKDTTVPEGKTLAIKYCGQCHQVPEPSLLDKNTWTNSVLPNMALRLGIRENNADPFKDLLPEEIPMIRRAGIYPDSAVISHSDWQAIKDYYQKAAPAEPLPQEGGLTVSGIIPGFTARLFKFDNNALPQTTMLEFDPRRSQLYVGDGQDNLYILDKNLKLADSWQIESAATDIDFPINADPRLLTIGVFNPSERRTGRLASLSTAKVLPANGVFIESLARPVQFATADLNGDGKDDVVVCEFGNHTGKLAWYDGMDPAKEHVLKALPGARCAVISDFNSDGKKDIAVLMSQAYEQVSIFYNQGNGKFEEKKVLEFSPLFGGIYMEVVDFNKDGAQDLLLVNGDNWDLSPIRKNYHGIRIFLNDGHDNFKETWFYPLYGATKALARDFDGDGDLDIAAVSLFGEHNSPEEGFVYLQNEGGFQYTRYKHPNAASGKWLTMEAGDLDSDGDLDIVLGSYFQNIGELVKLVSKGVQDSPQLLILLNERKVKR